VGNAQRSISLHATQNMAESRGCGALGAEQ
jgi:hypothetical protein